MAHATNSFFKVSQGNTDVDASENPHTSSTSIDVAISQVTEGTDAASAEVANEAVVESAPDVPHTSADAVSSVSISSVDDTASVSEAISSVSVPYILHSHSDEHVDHTEHADAQVPDIAAPAEIPTAPASPEKLESKAQPETSEQGGQEHLPEPPVSPVSNTLLSTSSSSTYGDSNSHTSDKDKSITLTPSANRLSISYANGNRRMVINSEVVEKIDIYRTEGRMEMKLKLQHNSDNTLQGILVCILIIFNLHLLIRFL